jgi:hypothetical protein
MMMNENLTTREKEVEIYLISGMTAKKYRDNWGFKYTLLKDIKEK